MNEDDTKKFALKTLTALYNAHGDNFNFVVLAVPKDDVEEGNIISSVDDETLLTYLESAKNVIEDKKVNFLSLIEEKGTH